jgi:WhiB family transcriptional regulator, redox-sensing transcriptional regulator
MNTTDDRTPTAATINARNWRTFAACRDEDPELWFPVGLTVAAKQQAETAKAACQRCAARELCLDWALGQKDSDYVAGGMTKAERELLKRRLARIRSKQVAESS